MLNLSMKLTAQINSSKGFAPVVLVFFLAVALAVTVAVTVGIKSFDNRSKAFDNDYGYGGWSGYNYNYQQPQTFPQAGNTQQAVMPPQCAGRCVRAATRAGESETYWYDPVTQTYYHGDGQTVTVTMTAAARFIPFGTQVCDGAARCGTLESGSSDGKIYIRLPNGQLVTSDGGHLTTTADGGPQTTGDATLDCQGGACFLDGRWVDPGYYEAVMVRRRESQGQGQTQGGAQQRPSTQSLIDSGQLIIERLGGLFGM